jgi:MoaA/NifB/PqqE/SkfB family radical SAM enzyme
MANNKIFCNVPWTNLHIYWDGSYGVCCSEKEKPYNTTEHYNLADMPIDIWYKSTAIQQFREQILSDTPISGCRACYKEESVGYESRRIKENFKSVIFTELAFDKSFEQSPWHKHFKPNADLVPIDWHVDFGNECNLACKMCNANASSAIATVLRRNSLDKTNPKVTWTSNPKAWANFLTAVDNMPIKRIHVMGGEPTMMKKYVEFIDYLIEKERFEISLSFVTNGTILNQNLIDKLLMFSNVDIEISIEAIDSVNNYIRQGSEITQLRSNIENIIAQQSNKLQLVLRTVPQLLNISRYADLIRYAWENKLIIEGIPLTQPSFMAINVLPFEYRQSLVPAFVELEKEISSNIKFKSIQNGRSIGNLPEKLSRECSGMINLLRLAEPSDVDKLRSDLIDHCYFWDKEYNLTISSIVELEQMFIEWGYNV